jgi:hypothetical protein
MLGRILFAKTRVTHPHSKCASIWSPKGLEGLRVSERRAKLLQMDSRCLFRNWSRCRDRASFRYYLFISLFDHFVLSLALPPYFFIGFPTCGNHRANPYLLLPFRRVKMAWKVMVSTIA